MDVSPFGKLSPELRNIIYELCCRREGVVFVTHQQPAITRVCKQIRAESILLSYNVPQFFACAISSPNISRYVVDWLRTQQQRNLDQIRLLRIYTEVESIPKGGEDEHEDEWMYVAAALAKFGFGADSRVVIEVVDAAEEDPDALLNLASSNPAEAIAKGLTQIVRVTWALQFGATFRGWLKRGAQIVEERNMAAEEAQRCARSVEAGSG